MVDPHSTNCAFAVLSTVLFSIGASLSTTRQLLVKRLYADASGANVAVGFAYIVPGLSGLLAALLQRRKWYICHSVLGSICLVVMLVVYLIGVNGNSPEAPFSPERCYIKDGLCICSISYLRNLVNNGYSCDDLHFMRMMGIASDVLFVLGAVVLMMLIIMSGILSRRIQQLDENELITTNQKIYFKRNSDASTT